MKFILGMLFFVLMFKASAQDYVKVETLSSKKYYIYVVEDGVTIESLAEDFKSSKEAILNANPGIDKNFSVGRKLMIPANLREILHEVKESETLYSLCKRYAVPMDAFKSDSTIINGAIQIGQILKFVNATEPVYYSSIRKNNATSSNQSETNAVIENDSIIEYKVNQGETLYSISKRYMVSAEKLQKLNNITPVQLKTGMILRIPLKRELVASAIKIKSIDSLTVLNKVDSTLLFPAKKGPWKIAMFLPFYLGNSKKAPASVVSASTEFFMGAKMAIDQIGSTELYVYDYMNDTVDVSTILKRPEFSSMDMIFAPLDVGEALVVANWCQDNNVPFVTTVPKANRLISNNPMAHFGIPSDAHMLKMLARHAIKNFSTKQVILVKSNQSVDQSNYDAFRSVYYSDENPTNIKLIEATTKDFGQYLQKNPSSVVVFASNEKNEVTEFINLLKPYSGVTLFGHKDWLKYGDAVASARGKYNLHFVNYNTPFPSFNYHDPGVKSLHRIYRDNYNADITGMVIYGYDVAKYFTSYILLRKEANGVIMDFDVKPNFETGGFENVKCYIDN
jgi:LysM repeat protein